MNKKRLALLLLVSVVLALLTTYLLQGNEIPQADPVPIQDVVVHESFSGQARLIDPPWVKVRGIGVGFVWPKDRDKPPEQRPQTEEVILSANESFNPYLILQMKEETTALVSVLLDFHQVEFELDGQRGLLHEVTLEPEVELEIPINVNIAEPGIHELIVLVFADPYNASLDPMYRMSGAAQKVSGRRATVIVGDENEIARELPPALPGRPIPESVEAGLGVTFVSAPSLTWRQSHPIERQLYVAQGKPETTFNYQIWASNFNGEATSEYAFVAFQDYHQVPVSNRDVTIVQMEPGEEVVLNASVQLPPTPGVSQMQIIYIFDPYQSILHDEVRAPFVFSSFRMGIHVTD